ncbi:MAG: Holliday junction branch migration protein RuvA [Gemmatimonadaceae bacterium]|nr:Holliday junction branch migration protein RuvA [Gemmatimonadaceae bacterium]
MIAQLRGTLAAKALDRITVMTPGGVGYELLIPLAVFETLPKLGDPVQLHTQLVVRDDGWLLFGFGSPFERRVFQLLLTANGVGPALALALVSHLTAERLVHALRDKDTSTLQSVPRVGRKKAERIVLDLADKLDDLEVDDTAPRPAGAASEDAIRALVSLGYAPGDADKAVRAALEDGGRGMPAHDLIRRALASVAER